MSGESARISALGPNNFVAKDDPHSFLVNPASLGRKEGTQISGTYEDRFSSNLRNNSASFIYDYIGLQINYLNVPGIEKRSSTGERTGDFGYNEYAGAISIGFGVLDTLSAGAAVSYSSGSAEKKNSQRWSGKMGAIYTPDDEFSLGMVLENIGIQSSYSYERGKVIDPLTLRVGTCISSYKPLVLLGGASFLDQTGAIWNLGAELTILDHVVARAGLDFGQRSYGVLTSGIGITTKPFQLDYVFKAHPALGYTNGVTMTLWFKKSPPKPREKEIVTVTKTVVEERVKVVTVPGPAPEPKVVVVTAPPPPPVIKYVPVPVFTIKTVDVNKDEILINSAGFTQGGMTLDDITPEGRGLLEQSKNIITYLNSLNLISLSRKSQIIIEANASVDGEPFRNEEVAVNRVLVGLRVLADALGIENVEGTYELRPMGRRQTLDMEEDYKERYRKKNRGLEPTDQDLAAFRKDCRNFRFLIKINYTVWQQLRGNSEIRQKINSIYPGLYEVIERNYQKYFIPKNN